MATRSALRQRVKELMSMRVTDPAQDVGSPSTAQINATLEDVRRSTYMRIIASFPEVFAAETTLTYTASAESVTLPTAAQYTIITHVQALPQGAASNLERYALTPKTKHEMEGWYVTGEPEVFTVEWGQKAIRIAPVPTTARTLHITYVPNLTDLTDATSPDELPIQFHNILAYAATAWYMGKVGDPQSQWLASQYESMYDDVVRFVSAATKNTGINAPTEW